jgi:cysteinyl-tRNA synthetase
LRVHKALLDNINTRSAIDALLDLIKSANLYMDKKQRKEGTTLAGNDFPIVGIQGSDRGLIRSGPGGSPAQALLLRKAAAYVMRILSVFGLVASASDKPGFGNDGDNAKSDASPILDAIARFRDEIRGIAKKENLKDVLMACDRYMDAERQINVTADCNVLSARQFVLLCRLRDESMVALGIRLEDRPDGTSVWKPEDPAILAAEQEERRQVLAAASLVKARNVLEVKKKVRGM